MNKIYKVLIIKNRYKSKLKIDKYLDWFKSNTPIEIVREELSTDFDVTPTTITNGTFTGVICGKDIIEKLRTVVPENKYNAVIFVYGNKMNGVRVSSCNGENGWYPLYPCTELLQVVKLNDSGKTANHELFHGFIAKAKRMGGLIVDNMDTYIGDGDLNINHITNRSVALQNLTPFWDNIISLNIIMPPPTTSYKHFKQSEIVGLKPEFVQILDTARGKTDVPFDITSGFRTPEQNKAAGGVANSSHTKGLAVDLKVKDNFARYKIINALMTCGSPVFIEDARSHIHVDVDSSIHALGQLMWSDDD